MGIIKRAWILSSVLFLCFSLQTHLSIATDTISSGRYLTGNQTIVSKRGVFELGFFTPGKSNNYYIGIWYKKISPQTVVWVANRDKPLSDPSSSQLRLLEDGNLVLFKQSKFPIWSTNLTSFVSNTTEAVLLDSGNFVLRDGMNSSAVIWQSYDNPTDTCLPGSKLVFKKHIDESLALISWKNSEDPAPGLFSREADGDGKLQYSLLWNRSVTYWSSGIWNGQFFGSLPEMRLDFIFNYSFITNENESYYTFSVYNDSVMARLVMTSSGQIKETLWSEEKKEWILFWTQPLQQCKIHAICGKFGVCSENPSPFCSCLQGFEPWNSIGWNLSDWSGGCIRKIPLQCENETSVEGEKDGFLQISNMRLPLNPKTLAIKNTKDCKLACLNNCSCNAYAYRGDHCLIWDADPLNLVKLPVGDSDGEDFYIRLAASELQNYGGKKRKSATRAIASSVVVAVTFLALVLVLVWRRKRRASVKLWKGNEFSLVAFGYKDLQRATNNFSEKLGGGGFGSVFKGTLPDSTVIAVKRLEGLQQGDKQFRAEVSTIGMIQHINLVRLRGFCSEGTKRFLVYDYMPNGSLNTHLFHQADYDILEWKIRYQIALGTARGLAYLHEKCRDCIIHCDIKPENILLDAEFHSKVADFGLSKILGHEFSRVLTTMRGTRGYLAPEWITGLAITAKADVYSYGMMLFEIISGRRNIQRCGDGKVDFFPAFAARKVTQGEDLLSLLDHRLKGNVNVEELTKACRVACWCIQDNEADRPSMGQVVQLLEGILEVNLPPYPRSLQFLDENNENASFFPLSIEESNSSSTGYSQSSDVFSSFSRC